ncbi:MAG: DUF3877 family protein [Ruminococcus sp.]|nr:DUF3877 family protein [Ruminococcus sp.]
MNDLIENIEKLHTTELGAERIKRNLQVETDNIVEWCREKILDKSSEFERNVKNWYIVIGNCRITVNAHSYTIITAHKIKKEKIFMNFKRLEKNITDNIREAQIKLGFDNRPISLNYTENSLKSLMNTDDVKSALEKFPVYVADRLGEITFREIKNGFCITIPEKGTSYVNSLDGFEFITEFVNTVRQHGVSANDVLSVFRKYSDKVITEEMHNGEFDYLVYFADGQPDEYFYCIALEEEIDGHMHVTYHRFIKEDYEELNF